MDELVVMALKVSAIGMSLLFVALAFLYGLMYLMTVLLRDPAPAPTAPAEDKAEAAPDRRGVQRAAVAAVALARAERELGLAGIHVAADPGDAGPVSPWWALHHSRQLMDRPSRRRS